MDISSSLLNEGLANILRSGGCQCDPPGSGQEFCTGHCYLRAEIERLRAALRAHHADIGVLEHDSTPCLICGVDV